MSTPKDSELLAKAEQAEKDLNTHKAKTGSGLSSDSTLESGVDTGVESKFPGAHVEYGEGVTSRGDRKVIPPDEGGEILGDGKVTRAGDFEGSGGPEDKAEEAARKRGGDDDVGGVPIH